MPLAQVSESVFYDFIHSYARNNGDALYKNDEKSAGLVITRTFVGMVSREPRAYIEYHPTDALQHQYFLTGPNV